MLRILVMAAALFLAALGTAYSGGPPPESLDLRMRTNSEFLKAAAKIVAEHRRKEAAAILRLAEESHEEAQGHVRTGEFEFANEDLYDSTRKAIHAIILATNENDSSIRDFVMKEEVALLAEREHERKEARLKKGMAEVDAFIKAAEKLLKDKKNEAAEASLNETRAIYAASRDKIALGDYDSALDGVSKAYRLATATVKEIKSSQGDILTFPKADHSEPKEVLAHEIKKNDAYAFFASSLVKPGQDGPSRLLAEGISIRQDAMKSVGEGGEQRVVERLRRSTELFIKAIKSSGN